MEGRQADECTQGERSTGITAEGEDIYDEDGNVVDEAEGQRRGIYYCEDGFEKLLVEECSSGDRVGSRDGDLTCIEEETGGPGDDDSSWWDDLFGNGGDSDDSSWWDSLFGDIRIPNPFEGLVDRVSGVLQILHTVFAISFGLTVSIAGYRAARWIDGERQINGSFKPFASRRVSRVQRGRALIGILAGLVLLIPAILIGLWIPLGIYLLIFLVLVIVTYFRAQIPLL